MENEDHNPQNAAPILIVEDSPTQAERLKYILEQRGYPFVAARNGREALAAIRERVPALVISDIVMPEMDGYQFCGHLKKDEKLKLVPVILLTSLTDPIDVVKGLECGADNFIFKPYDEKYLLTRITYMLANRHLRENDSVQMGVEVLFSGRKFFITSDRLQILNLLLSTYEAAVQRNRELAAVRDELRNLNRNLEAAVRANQLIMEHSLDVICTVDGEGRFVFVSPACERVWGYTPEELVGRRYLDLVHPDDRPKTSQAATDIMAGTALRNLENRYLRKDGSLISVVWSASWSAEEQQMFCVAHDVTQRIKAEAALREREERFQIMTRATNDVVWDWDFLTNSLWWSEAFQVIFGYRAEEIEPGVESWSRRIHPEDKERVLADIHRVIDGGGNRWSHEYRFRRADGSMAFVLDRGEVIRDAQGKAVRMVGAMMDITERKRAEEALRRAHEELTRANAELAQASRHKDEFLANMSHELRTPLNAILGMSELLTEQLFGPLTPRQAKSVRTIASSGQHLLALINDILDLSKIEAGKMELHAEPLNVDEFCQSCLAFVRTQAMQKQIHVDHQREARPFALSADPKRFKQILVNLLTNAVKFTPPGGRIGLTVAAPEGEGVARFTVWDTGIGIAAADQAKLFQAFTQVDSGLNRSQEGTGLGLALVARLAELHGGGVAVESEPGKGSRFIVTLPLTKSGQPTPAPEPEAAPVEPRPFRRALVIEDDPTAAEQLVRYLTELGLSSVVHVRGEESVEAAVRERPDVILLDILLPNESGWVALAKLREHPQTRDIPVAVVSVVDEPGKSRAMGAAAHFTKPVTREQLAAFLHRPFSPKAEPAPRPAPTTPASGPTILLAEDNEANIETLGAYLKAKGYDMHFALNGLIAVNLAREVRPALILMDIQMPMMDGLTAIRELRADAAFARTPIIALTALAMSGDRERCLAAGATDYMSKPVKLKELTALMEKLLPHTAEAEGFEAKCNA